MGISKDIDDFFDRLLEANDGNKARVASALGVNPVTFWNWYRGNRGKKNTAPLFEALDRLGVTLNFEKQAVPTMRRMGSNAPIEAVTGDDLVSIPIHEHVGAGNALDFFTAEPERFINILPRFNRKDMRAYEVDGDSMEPTIKQGAIVGVVPVDGPLVEGKIYLVCRPPFGLVIKEVFSKDGQIILRSANQKYPDDPVPYDGYDDIILGRVIWVWQEC
jgi:SOS-response transcriptional repressor LexA